MSNRIKEQSLYSTCYINYYDVLSTIIIIFYYTLKNIYTKYCKFGDYKSIVTNATTNYQ